MVKTNFSCSVPMRNCDLGLLPASNHATSSSRVSMGVMSTWSRAMRRFRHKGPRPYTPAARKSNWVTCRASGRGHSQRKSSGNPLMGQIGLLLSASVLDRLSRSAQIPAAAAASLHDQVDIGVVHPLARSTGPNLQIDRVPGAAVDQAMADAAAGLEARGVPRLEHSLAVVLCQHQFAFQHVDEFILLLVPVPQGRSRARLDARDV